jgi:hypothetical protein
MKRGTAAILAWMTFATTVFLAVSCQRSPEPIAEGEVCYRCRRVITDKYLAGEILTPDTPLKYKAPFCMAKFVANNPLSDRARILVTDYATGALVPATSAWFVPIIVDEYTNELEYRAYYGRKVAEKAAAELQTGMVRWETLVERAKG